MGAPEFNLNAAKTGTKLARLTVGELPKELLSVKVEGRKYRRALEEVVLGERGVVDVNDAHAIDTAVAATIHAGVVRWLFRRKIADMGVNEVLA